MLTIREIDMKLDDYSFQIFKWAIIDIIVAVIFLRVQDVVVLLGAQPFQVMMVLTVVFLCTMIATYDNIDNYRLLKGMKRDLADSGE